jgi:flagellar hook protein FlgE
MGLNSTFSIGLSGLSSYASGLSVVSDNVANANTTAFKDNSVLFADVVGGYYPTLSEDTTREGTGSTVMAINPNLSQGSMISTGNWSDLLINGNGYFHVANGDQDLYTRDGSFHIDKLGNLVTAQGYGVIGADTEPITGLNTATYSSFSVDSTGTIYGSAGGTSTPLAYIQLNTFADPAALVRQGGNDYIASPQSGDAHPSTAETLPGTSPFGSIASGALESSNVDLATEMVNMVIYQAGYTANSKSIHSADMMLQTAVNLVS